MLPLATNQTMNGLAQPGRYFFAIPFAVLGLQYFLWTVLLHAPRVATHLNNGDEWSSAFVALAMAGASFLLVPLFPAQS